MPYLTPSPAGVLESSAALSRPVTGMWHVCLIAWLSLFRNAPLFFCRHPRTPLRVLCIIAFDATARVRGSWLSVPARRAMIGMLDIGGHLNDYYDNDGFSKWKYREARRLYAHSQWPGHRTILQAYRRRLDAVERARPRLFSGNCCATSVVTYREDVVRLSLGALAAIAWGGSLEHAERRIDQDADLVLLFQLVMLAQLLDDILDWPRDCRRRLPTLLTMHASNPHHRCRVGAILESTRRLANSYVDRYPLEADALLPQRLALHCFRYGVFAAMLWRRSSTTSFRYKLAATASA